MTNSNGRWDFTDDAKVVSGEPAVFSLLTNNYRAEKAFLRISQMYKKTN